MPQIRGIVIFEYTDWGKSMARQRGSRTGRCQGCNHPERVRIERLLAAGASIKGAARKFAIDYHALRRHWRNHVSAEARAAYIAGGKASEPRYFVGLDLGQSRDPTAIAVARRVEPPRPIPEDEKPKPSYAPGSLEWDEEQRRLKDKAAVG